MSTLTHKIFNYKIKEFEEVHHAKEATCEDICIILSKKLGILPCTRLLFCLRVCDTQSWLTPCRPLKPFLKYEFRMRFKVPQLNTLKKLDENAYDYFYHQVRYDLVQGKIDEIKYPAFKDNVLGLGVVDMYIDRIEKNYSIEDLENNYKKYIPKELVKNHQYFAKKRVIKGLRDIKKKDHDLFYVKGTYLESVKSMAPNYLVEEFNANADYLPEDGLTQGTCPVIVQFNPFHETQAGLRVFYKYKNEWMHIVRVENIYAMYREGKYVVRMEISEHPNGYKLEFVKVPELKSFITYVAGYYRLSVKWMLDLCVQYPTPSLQELKELKYHGPVGGEFSYAKIREKNNKAGSYIVRQCEKEYDTYYIDINTKGTHTETFKITRECNQWHLHMQECVRPFDTLIDLALSIETSSELKFRIPPSEYDKPPLMLTCLPRNQLTTKKTVSEISEAELQRQRVQIFDPKIDLQWYKNSQKDCDGGKMTQMRADWILPGDRHLKVTLKILKSEKHFTEFMTLANCWSKMYSPEFLKLYGLTLSTPHTMVMEYSRFGPLNEFLRRSKEPVSVACLLEAVHGLVRAVVYLQENCVIHKYIRCSNLQLVKYDPKTNTMVAKLADPGFPKTYKQEDIAWIPFEFHRNLELAKLDPDAELWAFATTVWEIFSRGKPLEKIGVETLRENYSRSRAILPIPAKDCPEQMYLTMMSGWSQDPDKRFNQQLIFSRLASIKESISSNYSSVDEMTTTTSVDSTSVRSKNSAMSTYTDETMINGSSGSEPSLNSYSDYSRNDDRTPLLHHQNGITHPMYPQSYFDETPSVVPLSNGKVIYKEKIGEGHYGTVHRGEFHFYSINYEPVQVAIKTLKSCFSSPHANLDFMREIQIMKNLNHPNIVKILTTIDKPQVSIIMEYVECGSFLIYLSSKKPNLTDVKLLRFALDIANGMNYLRNKNVIHRDLAARNILVDSDCVKISDFGLAQFADSDGYYIVQNDREIPIKWYAPETIRTNKFSFQSDVWSYGVTLFEMFSRGEKPNLLDPNEELSQSKLLDRLENGERLKRPSMCPENIYRELMLPCWHKEPKSRPVFSELMKVIENILSENGECV